VIKRISHDLWFYMIYIQLVVCFLSPCQGSGIEKTEILSNHKPWKILDLFFFLNIYFVFFWWHFFFWQLPHLFVFLVYKYDLNLKGLYHHFHWKIKFTVKNIKILPKLRGYNNDSHQIAFKMEETQVKNCICKHKPRGVLYNTEQNKRRNRKQNEYWNKME
jgi:hypothetical protein